MSDNSDELARLFDLQHSLVNSLAVVRAQIERLDGPRRHPSEYRIALRPDVDGEDPTDPDTILDDIVVNQVPMFRAEQMDRDVWWVCCYLDDTGERITWDVRAKSKPLRIEWTTVEHADNEVYEHELEAAGAVKENQP